MINKQQRIQLTNNTLYNKVRLQFNLFFLALSFFTRLPVPKGVTYSDALLNQANRYFSLVGLCVGVIVAVFFYLISHFLPINISVALTMVFSLLITGAFHEDGLADMADGIGGAFEKDKRLLIMKDSRIGTYGTVTLFSSLLLKFTLLVELANFERMSLFVAIILSASLSRAVAASLIRAMPYVTTDGESKSKPLASKQTSDELAILLVFGALPLLLYPVEIIVSMLAVLAIFQRLFSAWLLRKISGFTGDCLGAAQQISEVIIYFILVIYYVNLASTALTFAGTGG